MSAAHGLMGDVSASTARDTSGDAASMPPLSVGFVSGDYNRQIDPPVPNGCTYYRQTLPARLLEDRGWRVSIGFPGVHPDHGIGIEHDGNITFGFDVTVLKLLMHATVPALIDGMRSRGSRVVVDVDDFHFDMHEENVAFRATDPRVNQENNRAFYEQSMRHADILTVSTAFLADFYSRRCRTVRLVRNAVVSDDFTPVEHEGKPTIGWLGGTLWRSGDIEMLREWLPAFVKDHGVTVRHIGHIPGDMNHFGVRAGLKRVQTTPMITIPNVPAALHQIQVGLVPLTRTPFNEAKSYLKGLEYAAAGIPFIATPTEEYRILAADGVGRLAETPDEWRDHVTDLLDPDVRRAEAEQNLRIVREKYDISVRGAEWDTALRF